jgi:hypothetical protein
MVACQANGLCLQDCVVGIGQCDNNGGIGDAPYGSGVVITGYPPSPEPGSAHVISRSPLIGLWCVSAGCFAAEQTGGLLASVDPVARDAWWPQLVSGTPQHSSAATTFAAIGCASPAECIGLTTNGTEWTGPPPPTLSDLRTALRQTVDRPKHALSVTRLRKTGSYRLRASILVAGRLTISWYQVATGTLIGRGSHRFPQATNATLKISLTRRARALLDHGPLTVLAHAAFTPEGRAPLHASGHTIRLR